MERGRRRRTDGWDGGKDELQQRNSSLGQKSKEGNWTEWTKTFM
jgi:hypothetical protein